MVSQDRIHIFWLTTRVILFYLWELHCPFLPCNWHLFEFFTCKICRQYHNAVPIWVKEINIWWMNSSSALHLTSWISQCFGPFAFTAQNSSAKAAKKPKSAVASVFSNDSDEEQWSSVVHLYFIPCRNTLVFFSWCYAFQVAYSCVVLSTFVLCSMDRESGYTLVKKICYVQS